MTLSTKGRAPRTPGAPGNGAVLGPSGEARILSRRRRRVDRRGPLGNALVAAGVVFFVGFTLYPLVYMLSGSFKTLSEDYRGFATLIPRAPTLDNYVKLLLNNDLTQTNFFLDARNSLLIAAMTIAISMVVALPAAYVLARRQSMVTAVVGAWIRVAQVVGGIIVIIPLYVILKNLGLVNTLLGVSLAEAIPCSAFAIWVLISFIRQIPVELEEAARIDGAGSLQVLRRIILPLIRPGVFSVILVVFLISWNDFLNPLILINNADFYTVTVALFTFIGQPGQIDWGSLLSFGVLACVPAILVIVFAERQLVQGLVAGTGK